MRLYRLSRIGSVGYDEAAGFVVAAPDALPGVVLRSYRAG